MNPKSYYWALKGSHHKICEFIVVIVVKVLFLVTGFSVSFSWKWESSIPLHMQDIIWTMLKAVFRLLI